MYCIVKKYKTIRLFEGDFKMSKLTVNDIRVELTSTPKEKTPER